MGRLSLTGPIRFLIGAPTIALFLLVGLAFGWVGITISGIASISIIVWMWTGRTDHMSEGTGIF